MEMPSGRPGNRCRIGSMGMTAAGRHRGMNIHSDYEIAADCGTPRVPSGQSCRPRPHVESTGAVVPAPAARSNSRPESTRCHQPPTARLRSSPAGRSDPGADVPGGFCDVANDAAEHVQPDCISPPLCADRPSLNNVTS